MITYDYRVGRKDFSFSYELYRNKKLLNKGVYCSKHTRTARTIRKYLEQGYATEIVLQTNF